MLLRFLRALHDANQRLKNWFDDLSLRTRRILAATMAVAIIAVATSASASGQADYERSGQLVRSEQRHHAVIVDHRYEGRGSTIPIVWTGNQEADLDYGWFLDSDEVGATVEYVVDPEDPSHLIAVGEASDWERPPLEDGLLTVVLGLITLIIAGLVASRMIPEDADAVFTRFKRRRKPVPRRRRSGGRH